MIRIKKGKIQKPPHLKKMKKTHKLSKRRLVSIKESWKTFKKTNSKENCIDSTPSYRKSKTKQNLIFKVNLIKIAKIQTLILKNMSQRINRIKWAKRTKLNNLLRKNHTKAQANKMKANLFSNHQSRKWANLQIRKASKQAKCKNHRRNISLNLIKLNNRLKSSNRSLSLSSR